jgi:Amt family ammonium transporter
MLAAWAAYIAGASALHGGVTGRIGLNVFLAASAGAVVALLVSHARYGKPDLMLTYSGLLGGLVAICGGGGAVSTVAAVSTGAIAGFIVPSMTVVMDLRWKIDDPSGLVAVHVFAGAWGTLAVGLFAPSVTLGERIKQLGIQALGMFLIATIAAAFSAVLFIALRAMVGLRLSDDAEYDGTDLAEHDLNAYPDFQQTMIKSYHMREA